MSDEKDQDMDLGEARGRELRKSRRLDVHRWSDHHEANLFVDTIYDEHFAGGYSKIRKKHLKVVLLDLYLAWCDSDDLKISFSRSPNDYLAGSIYNELKISRTTIDVVNVLVEVGLLDEATGFFNREINKGFLSRIWPKEPLIQMFKEARFTKFDIGYHDNRLPICLRDENGKDIEFEVEAHGLNEQIVQLKAYNDLLRHTFISIPSLKDLAVADHSKYAGTDDYLIVSQANKYVRRVYNRGRFDQGGRFFGGWWQNCPKDLREQILINDCVTVEIDYSSLHPTILYAMIGIDYWEDIGKDPYVTEGLSFQDDPKELRDLNKRLLLILINASSRDAVPKALRFGEPEGSWIKRLSGEQVFEAVDVIAHEHDEIAQFFHSDMGIQLQNTDAEICSQILQHFLEQNEPILMVHDSFIVRDGWHEDLELAMQKSYSDIVGEGFATKLKYVGMTNEDINNELMARSNLRYGERGTPDEEREDLELYRKTSPSRSRRYLRDLQLFQEWTTNTRKKEER